MVVEPLRNAGLQPSARLKIKNSTTKWFPQPHLTPAIGDSPR